MIGIDIFFQPNNFVALEIQNAHMLYFRDERRHGSGHLKKDLFLGHLQAPTDKNLKQPAILILEFDDVTMNTIYSQKLAI